MNIVLFSASLRDFRPAWFLWPIMLFFSLLVLSFIPAIKEKLCFVRSVRGLKVFAIIQCIMLVGHIYAFATQTSLDKGTQRKTTENELPSLTQCTA